MKDNKKTKLVPAHPFGHGHFARLKRNHERFMAEKERQIALGHPRPGAEALRIINGKRH